MLHRLVAAAIIVFWLVMTLLLLRHEINPDGSRLREVPFAHVRKILYLHEQASDLNIYQAGRPIGHLRLHPRVNKQSGTKLFDFTGTIHLYLAPEEKQRLSWDGTIEMTPDYQILHSELGFAVHEPAFVRVDVKYPAASPTAKVSIRTKQEILSVMDVPVDGKDFTDLARTVLADRPDIVLLLEQARLQFGQRGWPAMRIRQSSLRYGGDRTETYFLTLERDGQNLLECHVSQLGQVLLARTLIGYTLQPDNLLP
jgi:hypothetical protein